MHERVRGLALDNVQSGWLCQLVLATQFLEAGRKPWIHCFQQLHAGCVIVEFLEAGRRRFLT
jgi:hypothetical protein